MDKLTPSSPKMTNLLRVLAVCSALLCRLGEPFFVFPGADKYLTALPKFNLTPTCRNELFTVDKSEAAASSSSSSNTSLSQGAARRLGTYSALDCFGLGVKLAKGLDWFLRNEANGSSALRVQFRLATRSNAEAVLFSGGENFLADVGRLDARKRTMLVVHGFMSNGGEKWIGGMVEALLKWGDVNVLVVDWSEGANAWNYYKAAVNTRTVGDEIATVLCKLAGAKSAELGSEGFGKLHLIGHSLGSHICGYAAQELRRRRCPWLAKRITGLDPAQPCFKTTDRGLRLDASDAPLVDVIHTNGRGLMKLGLGLPNPIGHVDFYPNGGKLQPGCNFTRSFLERHLPLPIKNIKETICSHGRSYLYFIDSLLSSVNNDCTFWAHKWNLTYEDFDINNKSKCENGSCIEMGINAEKYNLNGTFLTLTGRSTPFCRVDEDTTKEVKEIVDKVKSICKPKNVESTKEYKIELT